MRCQALRTGGHHVHRCNGITSGPFSTICEKCLTVYANSLNCEYPNTIPFNKKKQECFFGTIHTPFANRYLVHILGVSQPVLAIDGSKFLDEKLFQHYSTNDQVQCRKLKHWIEQGRKSMKMVVLPSCFTRRKGFFTTRIVFRVKFRAASKTRV